MSLAFNDTETASQEYATRTEAHYILHVPYSAIGRAIRDGKLTLHLIEGKIQINMEEARKVLVRRKNGGGALFD